MRILHTSDWHFGKKAPVIDSYERDQVFFLEQLSRIIERENIDAVLCAGDIYDSGKVGGDAMKLYTRAAVEICSRLGKTFVVTAGNHDSPDLLTACDELLEKAGLYVRGRLGSSLEPIALGDGKTEVYALPFFQPGEAAAVLENEGIRTMTEAVSAVLDHIRAGWDPGKKHILMAHLSVSGAELSESDRTAANSAGEDGHVIGGSSSIRPELFAGFDYVALGHIHKPQQLAPGVCYAGSPVKYSFGREEKQQKGVWIYDTEDDSLRFEPLAQLHERLSLQCSHEEALARTDLDNTYLRLELTDRVAGMELLAEMAERFPLLMEFYGMKPLGEGVSTSLSSEDVRTLSPRQILGSYLKDVYGAELEDDLADQFIAALELAEKEESR